MAGRDQHVAEDALAVELEAAVDCAHAADPLRHDALVPSAVLADLGDVVEELLDGRVVAVEERRDERCGAPVPNGAANCEPGPRGRRRVPVALRAHARLPDGGGARPPRGGRIRVCVENGDLARFEPPMPEGCIRDEAGQPAADDPDLSRHCYLTEPAKRPCTKKRWNAKKTTSGIASEMNVAGAIRSTLAPN